MARVAPQAPTPADLKPPPLRITMLIVGTKGDVLPFTAMAKRLEAYGHSVRIASHDDLRSTVEAHGVRFYPLAGTARQMAIWAPSFSLQPLKLLKMSLQVQESTRKLACLRRIVLDCYEACSAPDPAETPSWRRGEGMV